MTKNLFKQKIAAAGEYALFALFSALAGILAFGKGYGFAVTDGIKLWAGVILPSLFPYFFITAALSSLKITGSLSRRLSPFMRRVFNSGGITGYAFVLSVASGYPVGAKTVADLKTKGLISESEAVRAAAFCSTPSPMFLVSGVGAITFGDKLFGILLFLCNLSAAVATGFLFSFYKRKDKPTENFTIFPAADNILFDSVHSAVTSVLSVGGLVVLFTVFTCVLADLGFFIPLTRFLGLFFKDEYYAEAIAKGLLECTNGLKILACGEKGFFSLPVAAGICGFGGTCIIVQSLGYLKSAKIKTAPFFLAKISEAVVSFAVGLALSAAFY